MYNKGDFLCYSAKERVTHSIDQLSENELQMVADYLAFLKFHAHMHAAAELNDTQLAQLYAEFAEDDQALAAEGMADYIVGLQQEDEQCLSNAATSPQNRKTFSSYSG